MTTHTPVLLVEGLSVRRGERLAVEQVSFQLARETDTALVGPNGAGKSSLVGAVLGLLPRSSGSVKILGHSLSPAGELPRSVRSQIAYLPQSLALQGRFPLTVGEFVGFGVDPPGLSLAWLGNRRRTEAVQRALERTGCQDLAERRLSALSGGQLKRVLLAFCVVRPRQLLVLGQPFMQRALLGGLLAGALGGLLGSCLHGQPGVSAGLGGIDARRRTREPASYRLTASRRSFRASFWRLSQGSEAGTGFAWRST